MEIPAISTRRSFSLVLFFGLLAMTARNATDPDLWWHLRTGQWIVENGIVPHTDPFSFTRAGHAWVAHEWLSEVVLYQLWKHFGATALIIFSAVVTTVGFIFLYRRCPGKRHWAAAATVIGAVASAPSWGVRPQMFTFALASLLLWLIEEGETRPKLLFFVPALFLLWVNLHAGFALGLALLFSYGFGLLLERASGGTPWREAKSQILRVLSLLLVCLAIVPLNPNGTQLYSYPFETLHSAGMRSLISEWFSPDFHQWLYRPFLLVWLLLIATLAGSRYRPKGRVLIPLLLTSGAALDAVRHIPIFVLLAMPVIVAGVGGDAISSFNPSQRSARPRFQPLFGWTVVISMAIFVVLRWGILVRGQAASEAKSFPQKGVAFLRAGAYPQRAFVYYDWGGYAIWKLYPDYRVFVDGRADLYGEKILADFVTAVQLRPGWREVLDRWQVESVLVPPSCALAQALRLDPGWYPAFSDSGSILLLRRDSAVEKGDFARKPVGLGYESEKNVSQSLPESAKLGQ